jgi:hypothetical protein
LCPLYFAHFNGFCGRGKQLTPFFLPRLRLVSVDTISTAPLSTKKNDKLKNSKHDLLSKNTLISVDVQKLAREKWTVNRGYSSGASSYGSDEDENGTDNGDIFNPKLIPRPNAQSIRRNISEASRLSDLREEFAACELATTIVRIEVRLQTDERKLKFFG